MIENWRTELKEQQQKQLQASASDDSAAPKLSSLCFDCPRCVVLRDAKKIGATNPIKRIDRVAMTFGDYEHEDEQDDNDDDDDDDSSAGVAVKTENGSGASSGEGSAANEAPQKIQLMKKAVRYDESKGLPQPLARQSL